MALSTGKFVLGRVVSVVIVIVGVTGLTWLSVNALRPDLRAGEDRFILVALFDYLQSAFLHFDFGTTRTASNREVADVIREGLPADLSLLIGGMAVGVLGGIAGGAYCAARRGSAKARALETLAAVFMCAPVYVVGLMSLLLFGAGLAIVQSGIYIPTSYTSFRDSPPRWAGSLLVPWLVLGLPLAGVCLRMMRASMAEVMAEDYLRTAMAKGLRPRTVVRRHAIPSAVAPVFTLTGVTMPIVVTNLVLIEQVFSVPGVFTDMKRGIAGGDFDLLFGLTAVAAGLIAVSSLVTDLVLAWLDPRVRSGAQLGASGVGTRVGREKPTPRKGARMTTVGLLVTLQAKPGKEAEVEEFLRSGQAIVEGEPATTAWFAIRMGESTFGIFDAFPDDAGRDAHLAGDVAAALMEKAPDLLSEDPGLQKVDVLADKLPG